MNSLFNILMGRALLSNYSLGFLAFWFYPIIVDSFNQDHHYHIGIPFYIYLVAIGFSIPFDMYRECLNFMVSVVRKQHSNCNKDSLCKRLIRLAFTSHVQALYKLLAVQFSNYRTSEVKQK